MDTILIGIAGGSGSGKTTLADKLVSCFGADEVSILRHDNYYKRLEGMTYDQRARVNYDHPDAFDTELLCEHIRELKAGRSVRIPVYDYTIHNRSDRTILVPPNPVIILEGIMILAEPSLLELMDFKIFVDTDARQYRETVKPMHEQFVEPSKRKADIIIPEGGRNDAAMKVILELIRSRLH